MKNKTNMVKTQLALFGNVRVLAISGMLTAMSLALAALAKEIFGPSVIRVTIENLPVIFGGIAFGPFIGGAIAVIADLLSCAVAGQTPVPLIAVGAFLMGAVSGLLGGLVFKKRTFPSLLTISLLTHLVGTITVKTLALHVHFGTPWQGLWPRVPLYIGIAVLEGVLLYAVFRNREIQKSIKGLYEKR